MSKRRESTLFFVKVMNRERLQQGVCLGDENLEMGPSLETTSGCDKFHGFGIQF